MKSTPNRVAHTTLFAVGITFLSSLAISNASAQFLPGAKHLDPFNKNSRIRERGRTLDNSIRTEAGRGADAYKRAHGVTNPLNQGSTHFRGYNEVQFRYTFVNTTRSEVRFRLPSGKNYRLPPDGKRREYIFTGYAPNAVIHVYNTGKSYTIPPGDHKFWTMPNGQVGVEMNYRNQR